MTIHQLRIFLSVSRHLNVTRASQELHISQPAVSRQLKQLSEECGATLYKITPRGIEITNEGKRLVSGAEQVLSQVEKLKRSLTGTKISRVLRIGESEGISLCCLPLLSAVFPTVYPGTQIVIRTGTSQAIEQMALNSEIEVAILTRGSFHPLLNYEHFRREKMVVFVSSRHPLAKKQKLTSAEFSEVPLVIRRGSSQNGELDEVLRRLEEKGMALNVAMRCDSAWAVKTAVEAGLGLGVLHDNMVAPDVKRGSMKIMRVPDLKIEFESYVAFHKERPLTSAAQKFLDVLRQGSQKAGCSADQLRLR